MMITGHVPSFASHLHASETEGLREFRRARPLDLCTKSARVTAVHDAGRDVCTRCAVAHELRNRVGPPSGRMLSSTERE
jgi:hypothetical protein